MKRLYKSKENKVFAGIIGGIGEYLNVDPVFFEARLGCDSCFYRCLSRNFSLSNRYIYCPRGIKRIKVAAVCAS